MSRHLPVGALDGEMADEDISEVLENQIWMGLSLWREAFVVPFIAGTVPAWSDACFSAIQLDTKPCNDSWQILRSPATDPDGWVYATAFEHLKDDRPGGRASKRANDRVRSRLWRRAAQQDQQQQRRQIPAQSTQQQQQQMPQDLQETTQVSPTQPPAAAAAAAADVSSEQQPAAADLDPGAMSAAAAAVSAAADQSAAAGKAAFQGASQAAATVQAVTRSVKKASIMGMWNAFFKLLRDAAERHNTVMITPDISGWFFVISSHAENMKRQQLSQLQNLVWFTADQQLQAGMVPGGLGSNAAGVVFRATSAWVPQTQPSTSAAAAGAAEGKISTDGSGTSAAAAAAAGEAAKPGSSSGDVDRAQKKTKKHHHRQQQQQPPYELPGRPFPGMSIHLGAKNSSSSSSNSKISAPSGRVAAAATGAGVQLHIGSIDLVEDLIAGARYAHASYGYAAAGGHLNTISNVAKMLATMPLFDPISGVSVQANTQALMSLAGVSSPDDVLLTCWHNDTFRPCHYVAVDRARKNIILAVRGSLEVGDLETDMTAAPLAWEFQGVSGWVHEGLLAAAAYVVSNTVDALAEAADRHPGWPLVVAGHSLGGGVAALVTLLLQQPGAAPRGISSIRCITLGAAAVLSEELSAQCGEYITSIILGTDSIPRLSTYSVESLLLDLVNASITRKITNQLAATTSSVAASTGAALNTITQGLTQGLKTLASSATDSVNNMAGVITNSLANNNFTGSFSSLAGLAGSFQPVVPPAVQHRIGPGSTNQIRSGGSAVQICGAGGTVQDLGVGAPSRRSLELARMLQGSPAAAAAWGQPPRGGLQDLHDLMREEWSGGSSRLSTQQQQQQQRCEGMIAVEDAAAAAIAAGDMEATQVAPPNILAAEAPQIPQPSSTAAGSSSSSSSPGKKPHPSLPGGPRLLQTGSPVGSQVGSQAGSQGQPSLIFPRVDHARILDGIHQACAEINCAEIKHLGNSASGQASSDQKQQQQQQGGAVRAKQRSADGAAAAAAASSSRDRVSKSPSESDLQSWASDGLQPLGEPSWVKISQGTSHESTAAAAAASSSGGGGSNQCQGSSAADSSSSGGNAQENTVKALKSDLRHTPRLYPPGRILWALTDDIVGPAAQQLMTAVAAHLASMTIDTAATAAAAAGSSDVGSSTDLAPVKVAPAAVQIGSSSSGSRGDMKAPKQVQMDMPASIAGKPQQQQQQQHKRTKREVARDAATAHAVAAASARHIMHDAHSAEAKRSAAAALHAAQHEHPPLHLSEGETAAKMELQLQQQQQETAEDRAAADASTGASQQQQRQHRQQHRQNADVQMISMFSRSASQPLEVDGSAPGLSKQGSNPDLDLDLRSRGLPPDLCDLINILGQPTDAASAIAIAHKKKLLLEHFNKQKRRDAQAQHKQQQQKQQQGLERQLSRRRSSSSSLLKYEDMIPPVDQEYVAFGSGSQQTSQQQQSLQRQQSPELELVSQSSRGSSLQSDEALGNPTAQQQQQQPDRPYSSADQLCLGSDGRSESLRPDLRRQSHCRSQSWSVGGTAAAAAAGRGLSRNSRGGNDGDSGMWGLTRTLSGLTRQQQQDQQQQQQLQLSMYNESEEYVVWAAEQAALHKQQQDERQQQQQQKKVKAVEESEAAASFQEMAVGSLIELAQLPERIAESLSALTTGGAGGGDTGAAGSSHPCDDSGVASLCAPAVTPATAAAGNDGSANAAVNRMPVIVMPERDVFGRLLVLKTSFQDHLPSNYIEMLHRLKAAAAQPQQPWAS